MTQQIYTTPTPFSGTNISIPNSGKGYTSNMVIKGQTYQNLVNGNPYYAGANTSLFHWELSENDSKITIKRTQTGDINWQYVGVPININLLKNDTTYTVIFLASGKCECVNAYINIMEGSAINSLGGKNVPRISGVNKCKFTTDHNTKIQNQILYIGIDRSELPNVNDYMTLSNFVLLEGDWTNKEVPSSVTGLESVGEKEGNKISILSKGKNLFPPLQIGGSSTEFIDRRRLEKCVRIRLKPNTNYVLSYICKSSNVTNSNVWGSQILEVNTNKNILNDGAIVPSKNENIALPFTTTSETDYYIGFIPNNGDNTGTYLINKNSIMLEEGTQATSYEPFKQDKKEILIGLDGGLKSLPNGVADTIEQRDDGVYLVQRVGKYVFTGNENLINANQSPNNFIPFYDVPNIKIFNSSLMCDTLIVRKDVDGDKISRLTTNDGIMSCGTEREVRIRIKDLEGDVNGTKNWFSQNRTTLYYELATPIETKLDIDNINLQTFKDLTYVTSDNNIEPVLKFKAPILGYKTINPIQLKTTQDGTEVNVYPYSTPELITFGDNETLADKMNNIENTHTHNNATVTTDGFMSKESYSKLESLTNYTHPSTHAATMITEDSTHRFITDTERNNWNAKASTNVATPSTNGLMSNTDKQKIDRISNSFDIVYDANTETIRFRFR